MALAFDTSAQKLGNNISSDSWTHTCTGSNLILFVMVAQNSTQTVTGVTYNSVALTQVATVTAGSKTNDLWVLVNPASGANTVAVSWGGTAANTRCVSASYTGAKQSGQPDSSHGVNNSSGSVSTTVVAANCWLVGAFYDSDFNQPLTAGQTLRETGAAGNQYWLFEDTNGTVGTGSQSSSVTGSGNNLLAITASIAPLVTDLSLSVNDSSSTTENTTVAEVTPEDISVNDSTSTTESITVGEITTDLINVNDSVSTSENLGGGGALNVNLARSGVRIV